jgi:iron-sulfur cluster repair protein YtfE (RIC family)
MQPVPRAGGGLRQAWRHRNGRSPFPLPAPDRMAALSEQLIHVHQELRERLASVRQEAADGAGLPGAHTAIGEDLLSHCLSFCSAIQAHHTGEDRQLLPALRAAAPELAPVIDNLSEDHALVAGILRQVRELLTPGRAPSRPEALVRELDGLVAILESHFNYEERRIAKALDTAGPLPWSADVFAPGQGPAG